MGKLKSYSESDFVDAINSSVSLRQAIGKLGLRPTGGNYQVAKRRIKKLGLDTSHLLGQGHLKGKTHNWASRRPLDEILVENSDYGGSTYRLKQRLLKEDILEYKCYKCGLTEWQNEWIPLDLEHINGNRSDHRIENLILLCPNCHAQTDTYRGKNKNRQSD